jgi:hypothetical protein
MTRNRQASRPVHLARPGSRRLDDQPSKHARLALRRLGAAAAPVMMALVFTPATLGAPPTATFTPLTTTATRGVPVQFNATATDLDLDPIDSYAWNFGDGTAGSGQSVSHDYAGQPAGQKTVTLTVTAAGESSAPETGIVSVLNAPPEARIIHAAAPEPPNSCGGSGQNPQTPLVNQLVGFSADTSSDPDNSVDADPSQQIKAFEWDLDEDGVFGAADGESVTSGAARSFPTPGNKTVRVRVSDSDDATNEAIAAFRVNTVPEANFISDDPTPVIGQQIVFASISSDPDIGLPGVSEQLAHAWDFDGDGFDDGATPSLTRSFATAGTKTVRLCVRDTGGIARMFTKSVLIQSTVPNGAFSFGPAAPLPGQPVTFTSTSTPTAGKQLTAHEWDFAYDGNTFSTDASGASAQHSFATAGAKTVALRVSEAEPGGGPSTGGHDIVVQTVNVNTPPQASFTVAPESGFVGETVTLSSTSSDPDGPLTKQEWDLDNDGQFDDANAAVVSARFLQARAFPLRLRVTDSRGATAIATGRVVLRRRPLRVLPGVFIALEGSRVGARTKISLLSVRAPRGSRIAVRCAGTGCPKRATKTLRRRKALRFKAFERRFRPRTKLVITVTKTGFVGKRTTFTIRRGAKPRRQTLCLNPGAKRGKRCPSE